jgi:hypothetical protein
MRRRGSRIVFTVLGLGAVAFLAALIGGRFSDGPLAMIPGGPLSGEVEQELDPDWSFARDLDTIDLQIESSPPRSVRTGVVVYEGRLYVPVTLAPLKRWQYVLPENPRVLARIEGRLFERWAVPVTEPEHLQELISTGQAKYGPPFHATWAARYTRYFRLDPVAARSEQTHDQRRE